MENTRTVKRKIATVGKIEQITKAMKVVATNRLRKVEQRALALTRFGERLKTTAGRLSAGLGEDAHPLLVKRSPVRKATIIVVGGDRGLCGAYNTNLLRVFFQLAEMRRQIHELSYVAVGARVAKTLPKRGFELVEAFDEVDSSPLSPLPAILAELAQARFLSGAADEVLVIHTHYVNPLVYQPVQMTLLPLEPPRRAGLDSEQVDESRPYEFEPSAQALLSRLLPIYLETELEAMLLESSASEYAARVASMTSASDNAADMIKVLTLNYNRLRQAAITSELLEVATGAEALSG